MNPICYTGILDSERKRVSIRVFGRNSWVVGAAMDVIFEPQGGQPFSIELGFFDTVLEIKEKVQKYQGIPVSRQTLFFNGQLLQDSRDIPSIQMFHNCRIQMIIAPDPPPSSSSSSETTTTTTIINIDDSPPPATAAASANNHNHINLNLQEHPPRTPPPPPPPPPPLPLPQAPTKIQLLVRIPSSNIHVSVEMDPGQSVRRLKEKIHEMEGIPVNRMVLQYCGGGVELQENRSLREYGLCNGSEIDVGIIKAGGGSVGSKKLKLAVMSKCGTKRVHVEVNPSDNVGELRKELEKLDHRLQFHLPPEGYFFIYKQSVMDDDRSFRWHHVSQGDTVEIFNGCVTGGS